MKKFIKPQHFDMAAEDIVRKYIKIVFWISPFGFWKLYELIKDLMT